VPSSFRAVAARVAKSIRERRLLLEMSQGDLARISDVSIRTIEQIEADKYNPSLRLLCQIAGALDVEVEELLTLPKAKPMRLRGKRSATKQAGRKKKN